MAKVWLNLLSQDKNNNKNNNNRKQQRLEAEPNIVTAATSYETYAIYDCCNSNISNKQQDATTTSAAARKTTHEQLHLRQLYQRHLLLPPSTTSPQLTSAIGNDNARFSAFQHVTTSTSFSVFSSSYSSSGSISCVSSSSNMNAAATAFAEDAATLELTRKAPQFNKQLLQLDSRSFFYLTLLVLVYCCVLMRASAVAASGHYAASASASSAPILYAENKTETNALLIVATPPPPTITTTHSKSALAPKTMPRLFKRSAANVPGHDNDNDNDSSYRDDEFDEYDALINNKSARGKYIGAPCNEMKCESTLLHVVCDKDTQTCGCERNYPVQLGLVKGCDKPKKLGEQCFYDATCQYSDENSLCVQVRHNAMCQCTSGFHSVSYTKPTRRVFCTQDLKELSSDLPTLLGVSTGIAVLAGLICMVLHLFSKTKYPRHRNFGDANLPPPIMYSSDTGIPLTVQSGRPSSRSSMRSSGSIGSYGNRRSSSGGLAGISNSAAAATGSIAGVGSGGGSSKGILVSTSRTGAARSAAILLISCHISALSKQNSRASSRQTSGAGCSANSRDNLNENENASGGGVGGGSSDAGSRSCDSVLSTTMTRHLQKQLNQQRQLLSFELSPAKTRNHDRIRTLLGMNGIDNYRTDDDDLNSLDSGNHLQIGALPTPASDTPRFATENVKTQLRKQYGGDYVLMKVIPSYVPFFVGSRRPSLASVHSTSSSVRSYSMMRFEKESQQKEIRQEMKLRLARLQQQQQLNQNKPQIIIGDTLIHHGGGGGALSRFTMPTPSPMTPNSLDELLPSVDEMQEYPPKPGFIAAATLAAIKNVATATAATTATITTITATTKTPPEITDASAYIGPCSTSTEAL